MTSESCHSKIQSVMTRNCRAVYIDPRLVKLMCIWEYQVKGALTNDLNGKIGKFIAENTPAVEFNQCFVASLQAEKRRKGAKERFRSGRTPDVQAECSSCNTSVNYKWSLIGWKKNKRNQREPIRLELFEQQNSVRRLPRFSANNDLILLTKQQNIFKIFQNPNRVNSTCFGLNVLKMWC